MVDANDARPHLWTDGLASTIVTLTVQVGNADDVTTYALINCHE